MTWIAENWTDLINAVTAVIAAASLIVKLTPTPKDDTVLTKVVNVLNALALNPKK